MTCQVDISYGSTNIVIPLFMSCWLMRNSPYSIISLRKKCCHHEKSLVTFWMITYYCPVTSAVCMIMDKLSLRMTFHQWTFLQLLLSLDSIPACHVHCARDIFASWSSTIYVNHGTYNIKDLFIWIACTVQYMLFSLAVKVG